MTTPASHPLLPLRDIVAFPGAQLPLFVGRPASKRAVEAALAADGRLLLITQRRPDLDSVTAIDQLHAIGTLVAIGKHRILPDGAIKMSVEGLQLVKLEALRSEGGHLVGTVTADLAHDAGARPDDATRLRVLQALPASVSPEQREHLRKGCASIDELCLHAAQFARLGIPAEQALVEIADAGDRLERLLTLLGSPATVAGADDDEIATTALHGFDPAGEPEIRHLRSGKLWLVFDYMPPLWAPVNEYKDFGRFKTFDQELAQFLQTPVRWDDREFFLIESPGPDTVERIQLFLQLYRRRHDPALA